MSIEEFQKEEDSKDELKNRIAQQNLSDEERDTLFFLIDKVSYDPTEDKRILLKHKDLFLDQTWVNFVESTTKLIEQEPKRKLDAQRYFKLKE